MTHWFHKGGKCGVDVSNLKINDVLEYNPHYVQSGSNDQHHQLWAKMFYDIGTRTSNLVWQVGATFRGLRLVMASPTMGRPSEMACNVAKTDMGEVKLFSVKWNEVFGMTWDQYYKNFSFCNYNEMVWLLIWATSVCFHLEKCVVNFLDCLGK